MRSAITVLQHSPANRRKGVGMTLFQIHKRPFFKSISATLCLLGILWAAQNQLCFAQQTSKSCLWLVKSGSDSIHLLGSLHVLKSEAYPLAAAIDDAYNASDKVVFETDMAAMADPGVQQKMMVLGLYPEGQSIYQDLGRDTIDLLKKKMSAAGLSLEQFARFKPWFLALTLSTLELARLGFDPGLGIDMHFYSRAKRDEKELGYLEPIDQQLDLLGKMGLHDQVAFLNQTLKELDIAAELAGDMTAYWQAGDDDNLHALLNRSFEGHPGLRERLLIQRNKNWVSQIKELIKQNEKVLVIVGTGHLVGPDSVVDMLKIDGYEVNQK
jgi:uncharacterized protein YbaP (TraB family)